ncbi:integral membrane protein DUF6 containing protein (macronuclear) [Tetrahymena thermophila SB210]|uniref:Integral membrane protein DUF6 containing protein n=1 Tax=Tetrahymena thermophila (strain SB210) TaxID=312017 RepID=Q23H47_TETTS|nr:integral membrane protein DUF6 containing protein [Tetrahymena thermophila SB210]EAR95800.1 integral membrane protein DUF6 containing protein [Tetrahymena thermophila SB210]|eukprot:XP_001016045.1 integral membrane protein DUF6 containing protein [Tetrahymena thermophila SB210]
MQDLNNFVPKLKQKLQNFEKNHQKRAAIFYAVLSQVCFTAMYFCVSLLKTKYSSIHIINMRMIIGFIFNSLYCQVNQVPIYSEKSQIFKLLTLRGILGGLDVICVFTCFTLMSVSDGSIIVNTNPIWTNFLAAIFLGEQLSKKAIGFCTLSFMGIILVSRPPFLFADNSSNQKNQNQLLGTLYGLAGSLFVASVQIVVRKLSHQLKCNGAMHMQYSYIICIFLTSILLINNNEKPFIFNMKFFCIITILSLCGFAAQLLQSKALSLEKASIITPMKYLQILLSFIIDVIVFKNQIILTSVIGAILIIFGSIGVII